HYLAIGMRRAQVKNLSIVAPGCNLGVGCAGTGPTAPRSCGRMVGKELRVDEPGQAVANDICLARFSSPPSLFQVFSNATGGACRPKCADIVHAGAGIDCVDSWPEPLLDDLDGDSTPSCDANCNIDPDDVAAACN